jgi:hypothetical protein
MAGFGDTQDSAMDIEELYTQLEDNTGDGVNNYYEMAERELNEAVKALNAISINTTTEVIDALEISIVNKLINKTRIRGRRK